MIATFSRQPQRLLFAFLISCVLTGITGITLAHPGTPDDKMKPEEVIAKHLASIGKPEDIAAAKTRVMTGQNVTRLRIAGTVREVTGPAQFASDGEKVVLTMLFNSTNYPYEKVAYDGERLTVAGLPTGGRSSLANFLISQDLILKHGLIGGALSSAWPVGNLDPEKGKLSYGGMDKINGRAVHELKYMPKKGDLKVKLYFDAETFQHVRTEYQYTISARMGARPNGSVMGPATNTGSQTSSRFKLTEDFSNFKTAGKLTLPQKYALELVVESPPQTLDYTMEFSQVDFDQAIDPAAFNVSGGAKANE